DRVDRAADQAMSHQAASELNPDVAFGQVHAGGAGGEGDVAPRADHHGSWRRRHQGHGVALQLASAEPGCSQLHERCPGRGARAAARGASEGPPEPAVTATGARAPSTMMRIRSRVRRPGPDPMGEPSGITVTVPSFPGLRASTGSALMYGRTWKPSATSTRAAFSVSSGSGKR